jgi:hypothetical protein
MDQNPPRPRTAADRWCNGWALLCAGVILGYGACLGVEAAGYTSAGSRLLFEMVILTIGPFLMILPRTILEIARLVAKHRRLASSATAS